MTSLSTLSIRLPVLRLSGYALLITIVAGSAFVLSRYLRISGQGDSFAYGFEIGRMLFNFGGMALLTPLVYQATKLSISLPKFQIPIWIGGLLLFGLAYMVLNNISLYLFFDAGIFDPLKFSKKLFVNFGHLLVLFYGATGYACYLTIIRKQSTPDLESKEIVMDYIEVKIDGIDCKIAFSEISHIETYDHYLKVYDQQANYQLVRMPLKNLLQLLPEDFIQVHRSWVVNKEHVCKVSLKQGAYHLQLESGAVVKSSSGFKNNVAQSGLI